MVWLLHFPLYSAVILPLLPNCRAVIMQPCVFLLISQLQLTTAWQVSPKDQNNNHPTVWFSFVSTVAFLTFHLLRPVDTVSISKDWWILTSICFKTLATNELMNAAFISRGWGMGGWVADSYVTCFISEMSSFITVGNLNHSKVTQFNVTKHEVATIASETG